MWYTADTVMERKRKQFNLAGIRHLQTAITVTRLALGFHAEADTCKLL